MTEIRRLSIAELEAEPADALFLLGGEDKSAAPRRGGGKGKGKAGTQVDLAAVQSAVKSAEKPTPATDENGIRLPPRAAGKGRGRKPSGDKTAEAPAAETPAAE